MDNNYFQKFSESAQRVLVQAQQLAGDSGRLVSPEHILLGLAMSRDSLAYGILAGHDVTAEKLQSAITRIDLTENSYPRGVTGVTEETRQMLDRAMNLAAQFGHVGIDTEHLLLALVNDKSSRSALLLKTVGASAEKIKDQIFTLFQELSQFDELGTGNGEIGPEDNEDVATKRRSSQKNGSALEYFSTDLTKKAEQKKLDPVIGREKEIDRVIQILSRRTKNNPVLIGEPGVGKTAIAEGLAQRIVAGSVPVPLIGKKILTLDLALLVAGTMYRGQFEERIKKIIDDLQKLNNSILFIDELHTIIGAGSAEGSLDAAQILKPSLAKGTLRIIGATTSNEYQKHIEKDAALTRRFQAINVDEPSTEDALEILKGLKPAYELHHQVTILDEALESAVKLSKLYITDRFLPDKAIDLMDEASALVKIHNRPDKNLIKVLREIEHIVVAKENAVLREQYDTASEMQRKEEQLRKQLKKLESKYHSTKVPVITSAHIEQTVSLSTGIPTNTLSSHEAVQLGKVEKSLNKVIIGQEEAVNAIAKAIKRSRTGIGQTARPTGSFIFLGPSGVGKTELARMIALQVFGNQKALVKVDMSEFMERHNLSRLLGAPAGYIGYEEGGKLTETIRRQPYSVVLLDEIEKAHPDVFNILLQVLEDGYLTDAKGRKIDFRQTIIIMTSNIGMEQLTKQAEIGFKEVGSGQKQAQAGYEALKIDLLKSLKDQFKPEFLNRLDATLVFKPLNKEDIRKIVDLQISELIDRVKRQKNINIQVDLAARRYLVDHGYDAKDGARPVRRMIQDLIEDKLADAILEGTLDSNKTALFSQRNNTIVLSI